MGWKKRLVPEGVCWGKEKQREGSGVVYPTADFWGADGRIGPESVGAQVSCPDGEDLQHVEWADGWKSWRALQ